jgi:hypothetical protein
MNMTEHPTRTIPPPADANLSAPELNDENYAAWKEHILPSRADLAWQETPWRTSFWAAVGEAQRVEKPLLLYAMNGHPLACT